MGARLRPQRTSANAGGKASVIRLLAFPAMRALASAMARHGSFASSVIDIHCFPDGESLVTLPEDLTGQQVAILASLQDPDRVSLQLRFAAATARDLGATSVGLVAPYLAYMRQDRRFAPGQAVSALIFTRFLDESFDWLVTVDPHLHRIARLSGLFAIPARRLETAPLIADWIRSHLPDAVLIGPDSESRQWVSKVATLAHRPFEVLEKTRSGDREVEVSVPRSAALFHGTPVVLDDIASSGRTMIRAIERLRETGSAAPVCIVIHAIFSGTAHDDILAAGAARIVSTNSIPHPSNAISLAEPLARSVAELIET